MDIVQWLAMHGSLQKNGRIPTWDPRCYISTHLFKARSLCRTFASLGAEIFKKLIREERYEHYRRVVFPNRTSLDDITFAIESPGSHLRGYPIEGIEFHLYPDGPVRTLEDTIYELSASLLTDGNFEFHRSEIAPRVNKLTALVTRQLTFSDWLQSSECLPFLRTISKLMSPPARLYIFEPELMPTSELDASEVSDAISGSFIDCRLSSMILTAITGAKLNLQTLHWNVRCSRINFEALENSPLAQDSLLNLRSVHLFISTASSQDEVASAGRLLMEFCKNVSDLTIEDSVSEQNMTRRMSITGHLLAHIPRFRVLTLIRTSCEVEDVVDYLEYAAGTIEEFNMSNVHEIKPPDVLEFANGILKDVPVLNLKKCSITPPKSAEKTLDHSRYARAEQLLTRTATSD